MIPLRDSTSSTVLAGVGLGIAGYGLFSLQDAAVKWLVADYTVWQILSSAASRSPRCSC